MIVKEVEIYLGNNGRKKNVCLKIYKDNEKITVDTVWEKIIKKNYIEVLYVIQGKLLINSGVKLDIEDKTKVLLVNGDEKYGQLVFESGSRLFAGNLVSYAIDPRVLDVIAFDMPLEWKKGDDILPRSTTANNGGWCFNGNKCPSINKTSKISDFSIRKFSGECLSNTKFAALNIYDMEFKSIKFDSITLDNCINNYYLKNSDVKIKKCSIENAGNCFVIDESSFAVTSKLDVQCEKFIYGVLDGSITITAGTKIDIVAEQAGTDLSWANKTNASNDQFILTSNKKVTLENVILFDANESLVDQSDPKPIDDIEPEA